MLKITLNRLKFITDHITVCTKDVVFILTTQKWRNKKISTTVQDENLSTWKNMEDFKV